MSYSVLVLRVCSGVYEFDFIAQIQLSLQLSCIVLSDVSMLVWNPVICDRVLQVVSLCCVYFPVLCANACWHSLL